MTKWPGKGKYKIFKSCDILKGTAGIICFFIDNKFKEIQKKKLIEENIFLFGML